MRIAHFARFRSPHRVRRSTWWVILVCLSLVLAVLELSLGDTVVPPGDVVAALTGRGTRAHMFLITDLRAPRVLGAVVVGACLGLSGAVTQSMMRNPLASPDIVGVTAGAGCAAVLAILTTAMIWLTGSLANVEEGTLQPVLIGAAGCVVAAALTAPTLGLLRFGEVTVRALGVSITMAQLTQTVLAILAASLATAVGGPIAFVTFCAPQIAMVVFRSEGPPALAGVAIVLTADLVARVAFPIPLPVGLVTTLCGGPILLWLLNR